MEKVKLARYVVVRQRQDGTDEVCFSVPKARRPNGWPARIKLPQEGCRVGVLDDPAFHSRVVKASIILNRRLDERRKQEKIYKVGGRKNTRAVANIYLQTKRYRDLCGDRQYRNKRHVMIVVTWAESRGDPDFSDLTKMDFEDLLANYDDRKGEQLQLRSILNILCSEAIAAGFRSDHPVQRLSWKSPKPRAVALWKGDLPKRYGAMARQMAQPGLAALIEIGVSVGQRLGDLRRLEHGAHYRNGRIRLQQSKTGAKVSVRLTRSQVELIESVRIPGSPFVFNDQDTGTAFKAESLRLRFNEVRHALTEPGKPLLLLRTLRHTSVCSMVDSKVPLRMISAVTGHCDEQLRKIVERYAVDVEHFADSAMMMLNRDAGGDDADFDVAGAQGERDWESDDLPTYQRPSISEARPGQLLGASLGQHRLRYCPPVEWPDEAPC